jgi:hypothetical protein
MIKRLSAAAAAIALVASLAACSSTPSVTGSSQVIVNGYASQPDTVKVQDRVQVAVRLHMADSAGKSFPIELQETSGVTWRKVNTYTAKTATSIVVFRVHPAVTGDLMFRAVVIGTDKSQQVSAPWTLHVTN